MPSTNTKSGTMKRLYSLLVVIAFLVSMTSLLAQKATVGNLDRAPLNFYEIQKEIGSRWQDAPPKKGDGSKQFKRWEYFWESRINPDGTFPSPQMIADEWREYQVQHPEARTSTFPTDTWRELGPRNSESGYFGIGRINCIAFDPTDRNIIWVGTPAGGLWKSNDGGQNWSTNTDKLISVISLGISSIVINPQNPNVMYIATGDARKGSYHPLSLGVLKSIDGGNTWDIAGQLPAGVFEFFINELFLHPNNPNIIFAATTMGLYRSENAGNSWSLITSDQDKCYDIAFKPGSSSIAYLSTSDKFYRSTDGGSSWSLIGNIPNSARTQFAVTAANPSFVALVSSNAQGNFNGIFTSTNSGGSFALKYSGPANLLNGHHTGNPQQDGQGTYDLCISISPTDYRTIYLGAVNMWKSRDGGKSWNLASWWFNQSPGFNVPEVHADKHVLVWQDNNTLFEGNDGGIYKTTNGGNSWTDLSENLVISQFYRIGVSVSDNKVIGGLQDNGTKLKSSSGNWTDERGGDGMECFIDPVNSNLMYGEAYNGYLFRIENGNVINGLTCPNPQECLRGAWVTPWGMDPNNRQVLYAGYDQVWKSNDRGDSWQHISPVLTDHKLRSLAIAPSNSNVIYTASLTQLYRTTDGGDSWFDITQGLRTGQGPFISYIAIDPLDPDILYVTFSNYVRGEKVYRSTDGGHTWVNISGSLPIVPANCITIQPDRRDALYIGTDVGVFYRDNSLDDWVAYNDGLPTVIVSELECKAATSKIIAATYGRGLWEADYFEGAPPTDELSITPTVQNVDKGAGTVSFNIQSNQSWSLSENERWLSLSQTSGTGNTTVNASYQVNTSRNAREAVLTLSSESGTKTAKIIQQGTSSGGGDVCRSPSNLKVFDVGQNSASFSWVTVSGAMSYTVSFRALPNGSWVTLDPEFLQATSIDLSGFAAGTTYQWRVKTNCANGQSSALAAGPDFTTGAAPTCQAPTNLQTSQIAETTATLSWTPVPGVRDYAVQVRKRPNGSWTNLSPATTTSTSVDLGGLTANTTYDWRVKANCTNGLSSNYSSIRTFTTIQTPTCNAPGGLQSYNISTTTVDINWSLVSGAANYTVQLREGNGSWQNLNPSTWDSGPLTINGLTPNTNYQWRVRAHCSNGQTSSWSTPNSFTTLPNPTCNTPGGLQTTNVTSSSVVVNWNLVSGASSYTIQTKRGSGQWLNLSPPNYNSGPIQITGLTANSSYQWRIRTNCSNGLSSNWSSPRSFNTLPPPTCNTPGSLQTYNVTSTSVEINWGLVNGANYYSLQTRISGGQWVNVNPRDWNFGPVVISGLFPNTNYQWRVRTVCTNGLTSSWSSPRSFTTLAPPTCNPPNNLYVTNLTRNSVVLRWGTVSGAASYKVQFFSNTGWYDLPGGATTTNFLPVGGLWPASTYFWRVIAFCSNGLVSYPSPDAWFTTFAALEPVSIPEESVSRVQPTEIWKQQSEMDFVPFIQGVPVQEAQNQAFPATAEESKLLSIEVFPNPSEGVFQIQFDNTDGVLTGQLFIYDATGRRLWSRSPQVDKGLNTWEVNANEWKNGLYMVRLISEDGRQAIRKIYIAR